MMNILLNFDYLNNNIYHIHIYIQMQSQKQAYKVPYHYVHIQSLLQSLLKLASLKHDTLILTRRTQQIIFSILSETQVLACGFQKIVLPKDINPYMEYEEVTLVITLSGQQDIDEIEQYSKRVHKVYVVNLGICTPESKSLLKKMEFKQKGSVRGYSEQNLDFFCYLHNIFILKTRTFGFNSEKKKTSQSSINQLSMQTAVDRLCSFLFSYETFSDFEFYYPKNMQSTDPSAFAAAVKDKMQKKLAILSKYEYKGLAKVQGMSGVKTRVIVLERVQQISPYILSLYYGPLSQQLKVANTCRLVSSQSVIYNEIYHLDILKAGQYLTTLIQSLNETRDKKLNNVSLAQTKKLLNVAYNPNLTQQQLKFHNALHQQQSKFLQSNIELLALQQTIGNKINEGGQEMSGSMIVQEIHAWMHKNDKKYDRYLGLIMMAFTVHKFWWWQKKQLIAGISDQEDTAKIDRFRKRIKVQNLEQAQPEKDSDGKQVRSQCFRHKPNLINQLAVIENQMKDKKLKTYDLLKVNQGEMGSLSKKSRTVIYLRGPIGYNELAMLLALKKQEVDFVCDDIKTTMEWTEYQLNMK